MSKKNPLLRFLPSGGMKNTHSDGLPVEFALSPKQPVGHLSKSYIIKNTRYPPFICPLCNRPFTKERPKTREHIIAKTQGGRGLYNNFETICEECNEEKYTHKIIDYMVWKVNGRKGDWETWNNRKYYKTV